MKPRVLVVDDDPAMVKTLADLLRLRGWEVATAYSGEAAVQVAAGGYFDVVLMDVKMPGVDGVEAFKAMKALQPHVRVVLMTAYAPHDRITEAEREGVLSVFPKPLDIGALLTVLAAPPGTRQPVLIVDNDLAFLRTLRSVLEVRGFDVAVAEDIDHARRLVRDRRPLAVLLHMHLGRASAREAVAAVHDASPQVALVLYSGQPGAADEASRALPAEWVRAYLQKPFAVEQLTGVLDEIRRAS